MIKEFMQAAMIQHTPALCLRSPLQSHEHTSINGYTIKLYQNKCNEINIEHCFCSICKIKDLLEVVMPYCTFQDRKNHKTFFINELKLNIEDHMSCYVKIGDVIKIRVLEGTHYEFNPSSDEDNSAANLKENEDKLRPLKAMIDVSIR